MNISKFRRLFTYLPLTLVLLFVSVVALNVAKANHLVVPYQFFLYLFEGLLLVNFILIFLRIVHFFSKRFNY